MSNRAIRQALCCLILLFAQPLFAGPLFAQSPITVSPGFGSASLAGHLAMLRDPGRQLTFPELAFSDHPPPFTRLPGLLGLGYTRDCVWIRLNVRVSAPTGAGLFLDLEPSMLDHLEIFVPRRADPRSPADYRRIWLGTHVPLAQRPVFGVSLATPIRLPGATTSTIYMRLRSSTSLALRGSLRSAASMVSTSNAASIRYGIYQGIFLLTLLINFCYWLLVRDKVYLYYALYLGTIAVLYYCINGLAPSWLMLRGPDDQDLLMQVTVCLGLVTGALFSSAQMEAARNFPAMHRTLMAAMLLGALAIIPTLLGYYQRVIDFGYLAGILVSLLGLAGNLILARRGQPANLLAAFAAGSTVVGLTITTARLNGLLPSSAFTDYAYETGAMAYMVQMTVALAMRTRDAEQGRQEAQSRALAIARDAEAEAEHLVLLRTRELELARKQAEDALRAEHEAQKEQVRFIDVISHQYRTPLSVVSSSASAIALSLPPSDTVNQERIIRIRRAIARLVQIIDVTLHRGRLEGAAARPVLRPAHIATILREMVGHLQDMFPERSLAIFIDPADEDMMVALDAELLELAIVNLVENAFKFSSPPHPVQIRFKAIGQQLDIAVADRGIGIPEADRAFLAQKFFRASNGAHTIGMGLGLHIVATIAHAHGGRLVIDSCENVGTTISLILPLRQASELQRG